jgi:hypothetical protein
MEFDEGNHHQCLTYYKLKQHALHQLIGSYHTLEPNPQGHSLQQAYTVLGPSHYDWEHHAAQQ